MLMGFLSRIAGDKIIHERWLLLDMNRMENKVGVIKYISFLSFEFSSKNILKTKPMYREAYVHKGSVYIAW